MFVCQLSVEEGSGRVEDDDLKHRSQLNSTEIDSLVRQYWHDVWQYAYFLTRREHFADDIAQDTFVKAMRSVHTFRGQCPIKNWLLQIARNTAFNYRRAAFLRKVTLVGLMVDGSHARSAEAEFWSASFTDEIWETVLLLPRNQREILILYAHCMLTYQELADLLGITEGTVKSRLHRARANLAKRMKEAQADGE